MSAKETLQSIIEDFDLEKFETFFREKNNLLSFPNERLFLGDDNLTDGVKLAEGNLEDGNLIICVFKSLKELSERSSKKDQYALGKKVLKDHQTDSGIFIFYDNKGRFRFSLIYTNYLGTHRDFSTFKRFTYFVSKEQTNKTFLKQIGDGDLSTIANIKEAFSVDKVTKEFYTDIANWYFWAVRNTTFPPKAEEENGRNIVIIRLITRMIFIWFMKERGLISREFFNSESVSELINDLSNNESSYYKAILQNLFFATLNTKIEDRKFRFQLSNHGYNRDYMDHTVYRYEKYFKNKDKAFSLFKEIPFLNGGLFECLDRRIRENGKNVEIRIDGFSDKEVGLSVPNFLFFASERVIDLNEEYGTKNKKYKVSGLLNILSSYNFTIDENVPIDQEVALDPELLGKVFENLLASYNPETATTARKATGSYYTPREIVDYMVSESLKNYFKAHFDGVDSIDEKLENLFSIEETENPFNSVETEKFISLIDDLRIVDPAVGSGAFPMGILNKLVFVLSKLDPDNELWKKTQLDGVDKSITDPVLKNKIKEQVKKQFREKNFDYGRKLYLIQKCIYGVDVQQIAVEIAKLRFFISLLVDEKIDKDKYNQGIEPLPNLSFKIMQGDSLISEFMGVDLDKDAEQDNGELFEYEINKLIKDFRDKKNEFQNESDKAKKDSLMNDINNLIINIFETKLRTKKKEYFDKIKEIEEKYSRLPDAKTRNESIKKEKQDLYTKEGFDLDSAEKQLKEFTEGQKKKPFFAWKLYFAEVFKEKGGFDIVIGNPPYIQLQKNHGEIAELYKSMDYKTFDRMGDIYCLFYERGMQLLKPNGHLCYISSNKWMRAGYGEKLRKFFIEYNPKVLVDLGPNVFESSTVDTNILLIQKSENKNMLKAVTITEPEKTNVDIVRVLSNSGVALTHLSENAWFIGSDTEQKLKEKIEHIGKPLKDWDVKIYRGILTGLNEAFIIDTSKREEILRNCKDAEERKRTEAIIKPILRGRDIKRYYYEWEGLWVIIAKFGFYKQAYLYPAVVQHLRKFEENLKNRGQCRYTRQNKDRVSNDYTGQHHWLELDNNPQDDYLSEFEKEKVAWGNISFKSQFSFIEPGIFINAPANFIVSDDLSVEYLCGIMNSKIFDVEFKKVGIFLGYAYEWKKQYVEQVKIPAISSSNKSLVAQIELLVDKIIAAKKQNHQADTSALEREIDNLVYKLYDLTPAEISIIEGNFKEEK